MDSKRRHSLIFALAAFLFAQTPSAFAAKVSKLSDDVFAPLHGSLVAKKIRIDRLPIYDNRAAIIDLEEFQVWAPGAKVILHGDNGKLLRKVDPPARRFFRGLVNGDPESFAFFSTDRSGYNVEGLVMTRERTFAVSSARHSRKISRGRDESEATDAFLTEYDQLDVLPPSGEAWQCEVDKMTAHAPGSRIHATGANGLPIAAEAISGTQSYAISIEIETDNELYVNAGSNSTTLANYIANLTGAVSTIYNRDLKTNVTQRNLHIYTTASDPWNASTADTGLAELGDYYHNTYGGPLGSGVIMLSGKNTNSGIAWEGAVCTGDFLCTTCSGALANHYGGPYAWSGSISVDTIPDPDSTQEGVLYGLPNGFYYWPLLEYAHEFGHVMAGQHTHCIALTAAEQTATGRSFVDQCYGTDPNAGCYSGVASVPPEKGTIMSYCHLITDVNGFPQSRYTFGQASEVSHHELDDFMLNPAGAPFPTFTGQNIVTAVGSFTISAISAPANLVPNSSGNSASVSASPSAGATYAWSISNGTITSLPTGSSIVFTAGATGTTTLRATAYSANGCGVTDTASIAIGTALAAPTGVAAMATSNTNVQVSWNAVTGATSYNVYRSNDGTNYVPAGSASGSPFNDPAVAQNYAYLYKVRAFDGVSESADSNIDLATVVMFTNTSLTADSSTIQAVDITDLRAAVNAVRALASVAVTALTDPTLDLTVTIKAAHITELRSILDQSRAQLHLAPVNYTNPTITAGSSTIQAVDILDLRAGVQ